MSSEVVVSGVREKKSKKDKKDKKERKRPNDGDTEERIAKKLKSLAVTEDGAPVEEKKKKKKKHKEKNGDTIANTEVTDEGNSGAPNGVEESRSKKKSKKEKRRKHQQDADDTDAVLTPPVPTDAKAQPVPASPPPQTTPIDILQPSDAPEKPKFPLFSRKIKEYVPIFPAGFGNALEFAKSYHLGRRLNNFVPDFGGVMLSYKNAALSEYRDELSEGPLLGANIGEYGASFVWLHVDVGLFMPRRNAWMEGRVNLQDHEHIGIVCWRKFNAFVEAKRLPSGWKWVDETSDRMDVEGNEGGEEEEEKKKTEQQEQQHGGHWVDEKGEPIQDRLIRFRIKNYDASASEDQSFLSIEGTMLAEEDEKNMVTEEERQFARRSGHSLADWGMTRMGKKEEDER